MVTLAVSHVQPIQNRRKAATDAPSRGETGVKPVIIIIKELVLGGAGKLEVVDTFCYMGDMLSAGGRCQVACRTRAKCAWGKFMELLPLHARRGVSLKIKGKIYSALVQSVMLFGS